MHGRLIIYMYVIFNFAEIIIITIIILIPKKKTKK